MYGQKNDKDLAHGDNKTPKSATLNYAIIDATTRKSYENYGTKGSGEKEECYR